MSAKKLKVGDIVRRKLKKNSLIGPYLRVEVVKENGLTYCSIEDEDTPNELYLSKNLGKVKHISLAIPESILDRLKFGHQIKIRHDATVRWQSAFDKQVELITFFCKPKMYKYTFAIERITESEYKGVKEIIVEIKRRIII